jgi:hypothetical protein
VDKALAFVLIGVVELTGGFSASGVAFTRDASTGEDVFNGEYLTQGADVSQVYVLKPGWLRILKPKLRAGRNG